MTRKEQLLSIRPLLTLEIEQSLVTEQFQNETLRPILKFQNDFVVRYFEQYCLKRKNVFSKMDQKEKRTYIENSLTKDQRLKQTLLGAIIGFFTIEEYENYLDNDREYKRRIITMLVQRLQNNLVS